MMTAQDMREAAAKVCDGIAGNTRDFCRDYRRSAGNCAMLIRALPIPPVDVNETVFRAHQSSLVLSDERQAALMEEVVAALEAAEDALANSEWSGVSQTSKINTLRCKLPICRTF